MFGKSDEEKWRETFSTLLHDENYRYKQNIGSFASKIEITDILRLIILAVPEVDEAIDQMYVDCEKGVPPEKSIEHVITILKRNRKK